MLSSGAVVAVLIRVGASCRKVDCTAIQAVVAEVNIESLFAVIDDTRISSAGTMVELLDLGLFATMLVDKI